MYIIDPARFDAVLFDLDGVVTKTAKETIYGPGKRKNDMFRAALETEGVEVYGSTVRLIERLRSLHVRTGIVSSGGSCGPVLEAAGMGGLFDVKVDGLDVRHHGLEGRPGPDIFLEAARRLGVEPQRSVVVEDTVGGVEAGRRGGFGCVIGVDRGGRGAGKLLEHGADMVVEDLGEVGVAGAVGGGPVAVGDLPGALERKDEIARLLAGRELAVFLDYDGTLTPIASRPELAVLSDEMRGTVEELAACCTVAVVSGRDLEDVRGLVKLDGVYYAGSHGFDIAGPDRRKVEHQAGMEYLPVLDEAESEIRKSVEGIEGVLVERKKFSIAVHYRNVPEDRVGEVNEAVEAAACRHAELRRAGGKKVYELRPDVDWDKGKALLWLMGGLGLDRPGVIPVYIGDDLTDEDVFRAIRERGLGIVVGEEDRPTAARYTVADVEGVRAFLNELVGVEKARKHG